MHYIRITMHWQTSDTETRQTGGWHLSTSFYFPSPDPHLEWHVLTKGDATLKGMRIYTGFGRFYIAFSGSTR